MHALAANRSRRAMTGVATIGPIALPEPGRRSAGEFTFSGDPGLEKYRWPYIALRGPAAGPTVLITEGIFHPAVRIEQRVVTGERVGDLIDLVGEPIAEVHAPSTGIVLFIVTSPAIKKDGLLLAVGAV